MARTQLDPWINQIIDCIRNEKRELILLTIASIHNWQWKSPIHSLISWFIFLQLSIEVRSWRNSILIQIMEQKMWTASQLTITDSKVILAIKWSLFLIWNKTRNDHPALNEIEIFYVFYWLYFIFVIISLVF